MSTGNRLWGSPSCKATSTYTTSHKLSSPQTSQWLKSPGPGVSTSRLPSQGLCPRTQLYLLHRGPRGAGPCASSPSSFSAGAAGPSWTPHGFSPRTPAGGQSVGCRDTGLQHTKLCQCQPRCQAGLPGRGGQALSGLTHLPGGRVLPPGRPAKGGEGRHPPIRLPSRPQSSPRVSELHRLTGA